MTPEEKEFTDKMSAQLDRLFEQVTNIERYIRALKIEAHYERTSAY